MDIFNNTTKVVADDLTKTITSGSRISMAAACFSIYAYQALKEQLEACAELRFIFTSPTFVAEKTTKERREFYIPRQRHEKSLYGTEFEVRLRNEMKQKAVAKECAAWIKRKAQFRTNTTRDAMNHFLVVENEAEAYTYMPMNSFTTVDLGCERGNNLTNMVTRFENPNSQEFLRSFNAVWQDEEKLSDVTEDVAAMISAVYRENPPELVYFMILYHIFSEFLEDISEDVLPNEASGFKNTVIWGKLYNFQKDAVLAIINKLEMYHGCILADSVGLGKTFTALAVIRYYEERNKNVLVLCPKKLAENWLTYRGNLINNPLAKDRLRYDVLYHTDLSRDSGNTAIGLPIDRINWGNYDLVVIDESHNFRNGTGTHKLEEGKENRYMRLMNRIIKPGITTKVLMLSATPVNNRFYDLRNQLGLAYEGNPVEFIQFMSEKYRNNDKVVIGAGTVLDPETARAVILAGANYVVSPGLNVDTIKLCNRYRVPMLPGVMSPTEAITALESGCDIIKVFPGNVVGPGAISSFKGPLPQGDFMPSGGVDVDNVDKWLKAGACAVGTGSSLTKGAATGDFAAITAKAKEFVEAVAAARK